jgi:hypothetical protein
VISAPVKGQLCGKHESKSVFLSRFLEVIGEGVLGMEKEREEKKNISNTSLSGTNKIGNVLCLRRSL